MEEKTSCNLTAVDAVVSHYKSTVIGFVLCFAFYVQSHPADFPLKIVHFADWVFTAGIAIIGLVSKDTGLNGLLCILQGRQPNTEVKPFEKLGLLSLNIQPKEDSKR